MHGPGPVLNSTDLDSAHSGSYSIYRALAIAMNTLDPNHKPDYTNTHPPFDLPPQPSWFDKEKIVSLDPWGHMAQTTFKAVCLRQLCEMSASSFD